MLVYEYQFKALNGAGMPLERWNGQPLLLVNTASECGYTPQYEGLENLWREYRASGLVLIGLPCNQFGGQEPGSDEEIAEFCSSRFDVTFPMSTRIDVNGREAHPLF